MADVQYIIHCWLDVEGFLGVSKQPFMQTVRTQAWAAERANLFLKYNLPSLLNQEFQDFRIFLFCGKSFKPIHDQLITHPKVEKIYDYGQQVYQEIDSEYVNIMRIDSDDMFRNDLMDEVVQRTQVHPKLRTCMVFKNVIQWNVYHNFVSDYRLPRSPFCSHTFPKAIYKKWDAFGKQQFMDYKTCPKRGTSGKICIVRHTNNVTWPRIGKDPTTQQYLEREKARRNNFTTNKSEIFRRLKRFGVNKGDVFK